MKTRSVHNRVIDFLKAQPGMYTATDIQYAISTLESPVKLSYLSSELKKMCDNYDLRRTDGFGPHGGYGYTLNTQETNT